MRIAGVYLEEIISLGGSTRQGPLSCEATCRLALDLREARETIKRLKEEIAELERMPRRHGKVLSPGA
jgi:hypothetical protein